VQKLFPFSLTPIGHHFRLQPDGDLPDAFVLRAPSLEKPESIGAAVALVPEALDPSAASIRLTNAPMVFGSLAINRVKWLCVKPFGSCSAKLRRAVNWSG